MAEVKELLVGKDVFPRRCDVTGKGMDIGWYLDGIYIIDNTEEGQESELLTKYVRETFDQSLDEFWAEIKEIEDEGGDCQYYWTDWLDTGFYLDDALYLENGTMIVDQQDTGEYTDENNPDIIYKIG